MSGLDGHSSGTTVASRLARPTRTTTRKPVCRPPDGADRSSLLGLAPGGVYRAVPVAGDAVRSCRTLSPLPAAQRRAVCFLWHFPWGRPRRVLPGTVFPWSPDFPPAPRRWRPSGCLTTPQPMARPAPGQRTAPGSRRTLPALPTSVHARALELGTACKRALCRTGGMVWGRGSRECHEPRRRPSAGPVTRASCPSIPPIPPPAARP